MSEHKRNTVLAGRVRFYYPMLRRTYQRIKEGDGAFIERYVQERDTVGQHPMYSKLYSFEYEGQLYASNEEMLNAAIDCSASEFEDWYFEDYLLNKSKYERTH